MPTHEQLVIQSLQREINFRINETKGIKQQLYMMQLASQSMGTLAAIYKVELKQLCEICNHPESTLLYIQQNLGKAEKALAMATTEPVNRILVLEKMLQEDKGLIGAQKNMIEQMEGEVNKLNASVTNLRIRLGEI